MHLTVSNEVQMSVLRNAVAQVRPRILILGLVTLLALATRFSSAQDVPSDSTKSTISGTVINAVTRAPIPRALVTSADNRYAMLTDSSGHFEFHMEKEKGEAPSAGGFMVNGFSGNKYLYDGNSIWFSARKPGFLMEGENGAMASPGQEATIALTPEALIVGRVTFSPPETTASVNVQLFFRQVQDGLPRWTQQQSATTNSAGEFRFANLRPGSYKLSTAESLDNDPGATIARTQTYGFPPVYYPNASDFSTAGIIEVSAGQTVEADLSLQRQPYYQVRIPVNGDISGGVNIVVSPQGHHGPGYSLGINQLEHRIEGLLPNGNYVVDAISYGENAASGTANLRVAGGPAEGTALTTVPNSGIILNVKEEFSNQNPLDMAGLPLAGRSFTSRLGSIHGPRAYLGASLEPADDFAGGSRAGLRPPLGPDDQSLVLNNASPGRYWLRLYPGGRGYVASATMGAIDLLHQPLTVTAGSGGQVDITIRDDFASVEGTVTGVNTSATTNNPYATSAWVFFVPLPDSSGEATQTSIDPQGHFGPLQMGPGSYRVLAFPRIRQDIPYRDAQAMKPYETKGQVIHLEPGQKANLQIQVMPEE